MFKPRDSAGETQPQFWIETMVDGVIDGVIDGVRCFTILKRTTIIKSLFVFAWRSEITRRARE